ncbi:radical SAM protein [Candidatus Bathyarchaeota archaeon]|nr:radical SAM protein [Candidatus Bathyarchaeota archaeon]NIU80652.1 radical SAM protein [Candidatus Bathyarchaeota archaeon]NIV67273.1 radical SAM protein [Candidatus Bathyarchaeota archaeon]NIW15839.1 radical SAM protein [Candidatus Bathyarchaeota archaeon]NIW33961.1 radical SAM protein [Candidatus Bathyarchaeota archaeon]
MSGWQDYQRILQAEEKEFERIMAEARDISWRKFGRQIRFYAPSFAFYKTRYFSSSPATFPSISVTGSSCALRCKHCGSKVLETMLSAATPRELVEICRELKSQGCTGCLISGGCLSDGSVPLDRFTEAIIQIKRQLELNVLVHTGLVKFSTAESLKKAKVDAALIDVIGSDETIRDIYRLKATVKDYDRSLQALNKVGIPIIPHVLVGLHHGKLRGELKALKMISNYSPSAVVVIAFMPVRGTLMENVTPPKPREIVKVLVAARLMLPDTPLALGCMRPKGKHRIKTDILAVRAGVNAIAFPQEEAIQLAESMGLRVEFSSSCCSQIFQQIQPLDG